ncbi:CotH kinase family protein [Elizabethkingia bruuniana]|uniref:CotH kinase family protein n=1 Tax=Elizabethkingia bruuniana TaxID=1756149 RepID=UPI00398C2EBB
MDFIDEVIDLIRKETAIGGNRRERIANALQLLRDNSNNFKEPATVSRGKLSMRTDGENLYFTDSQNKEQEIILSDEFRASVNMGITGTAEINTVPDSTKYERWKIAMPGTYPNFIEKDSNGNNAPVTITPKEFEENEITLSVTNGIAKKEFSKKINSKIETWSEKGFEKGRQVFHKEGIYEAVVDTQATDVPGEALETIWKLKLQGVLITLGNKSTVQFIDADGKELARWDDNGNFVTNYDRDIIPENAVRGLSYKLRDMNDTLSKIGDAVQFRYTYNRSGVGNSYFKLNLRSDIADFVDSEMKKYMYVDENGVVFINKLRVGSLKESKEKHKAKYPIFEGRELVIPEQTFMYVDFVYGTLPVDNSPERLPTSQVMVLRDANGKHIATLNTTLAIQGNYTAGLSKKGYSIDLFNDEGKDVTLKIGDRPALKGFHLKSYYTDFTQTRDVGAGKLWQTFIKSNNYPYNHFKGVNPVKKANTLDFEQFSTEAQYALIGVPCEVRMAGRFEGLYTWRTKKTDPVYAINSKKPTCISLESQGDPTGVVPVALGGYAYSSFEEVIKAYEIRSPKTKNITQVTKDKTMRFFNWCRQVFENGAMTDQQVRDTHKDYIILPHWIDWIIIAEFLIHWDSIHNNASYISYDGDHFSPGLIDCDHTLDNAGTHDQLVTQLMIKEDIFLRLRNVFLPEIKARYAQLRRSGILSDIAIQNIYGGISKNIPWEVYVRDFKRWNRPEWYWWNQFLPSMDMLYSTASRRLKFLDSQWLNP